jgi:predicted metal-dependent phosphoesterase TrpH
MTPMKIVHRAVQKGLSMIAITDHNSAENTQAVINAARESDLRVIPGMEVTTAEEAHLIALFDSVDNAMKMQEITFERLQQGENDENLFGIQVVANEHDEVEEINKRLLIGATSLSLSQAVGYIHQFGGLAIGAHIDREAYSIISQLGFIPDDLELDGIGISRSMDIKEAMEEFSMYRRFPFLTNSDSHDIDMIGRVYNVFLLEHINFKELAMALKGEGGRGIQYDER